MDYISLVDLGITLFEAFFSKVKNQLPVQVAEAVRAAIDQLAAHKDDLLTKANFEAERG